MAPPPTRVRHEVVGVATLMAVLLYLDRNCLPLAATYVQQDLGLTDVQFGWAISAFYLSYALGQVPSGWLTDRFGARVMLTLYILLWSLFTGLTGAAIGFASILLFRLAMGLGQAGAYPTGANLISKWVPFSNRGFASAVVSFGGRIGGSLAPLLTGYLIVAFTPLSQTSLLAPGDLLDAGRLSEQLLVASPAAASDVEPASRVSLRLAALIPAAAEAPLEENRLRESLNAVIRRRDAFQPADMLGLSLEKEGTRLLKRELAELSQSEVERLNRLVLEAAFPHSIRKVYGAGWRWVMFAYGFTGVAIAAACWSITRNRPGEHPRVNEVELDLIRHGRPKEATSSEGLARGLPLKQIVTSRSLWLSCLSQWMTNFGWMFLVAWLPTYLERVHRTPVETRAWLVLVPFTVGWAGMLLGGRITDRLVSTIGLRWGRALPMSLTRFVAMAAYLVCLFDVPTWAVVACFSVVAFATDLGTSATWAFCQDVGGSHVGSILGWGNMWGNFGAFATPPVLIWLVGDSYSWDRAFLACAAAFFVSGIAALGINAAIPIAAAEK
jgi:MFS transporter, ACS family, glucarate transporter